MEAVFRLGGLDRDRPAQNGVGFTGFQGICYGFRWEGQVQQDENVPLIFCDLEAAGTAEGGQIEAVLSVGYGNLSGLSVGIPASRSSKAAHELELAGDGGTHQGSDVAGAPVEKAGDLPGFLVAEGAGIRGGKEKKRPNRIEGFPEEEEHANHGKNDKVFPFCFHHHHLDITLI